MLTFDGLRRAALERLTDEPLRDRLVAVPLLGRARDRFVAGPAVDDALGELAELRRTGRRALIHPLLPDASTPDAVAANLAEHRRAVLGAGRAGLDAGYVPKVLVAPEHLGAAHDPDAAGAALAEIVDLAARTGVGVMLRSGPSQGVDHILALAAGLRRRHDDLTVSVVARRHRSERDCARLVESGARVRLVRGGPHEPASIAWADRHETDLAFVRCLRVLLDGDVPPVVATQEPRLLEVAEALVGHQARPVDEVEFQMSLGASPDLQRRMADAGHRVRVAVPYGPQWLDHLADLAGRPAGPGRLIGVLTGQG